MKRWICGWLVCCGVLAIGSGVSAQELEPEFPETLQHNTVAGYYQRLGEQVKPAQAWDAKTPEQHEAWREKFHATVVGLLGKLPDPVPLEVKWVEKKEFETFTRHKIYVHTEELYWAPVYYFVPHDIKEKRPAIVCLHGHSGVEPYIGEGTEAERKKSAEHELDYAVYMAKHGYVTAAMIVRGWNETVGRQDHGFKGPARSCSEMTMNAFLLGMTPQGIRCHDAMRVVDFLETQKEVDADKIAVAGLSGGGTLSMYLPILDPRIKATLIAGAFSDYRTSIYAMHHCICNCLPGIMREGEMSDVMALHAPRGVLLINGIHDRIFPIAEARIGHEKLKQVYSVLGAEGQLDADFFDGPHAWSNNKTLEFLEQVFGD